MHPRSWPWILLSALTLPPSTAAAQCSMSDGFEGGFHQAWVETNPERAYVEDNVLKVKFYSSNSNEFHGAVLDPCVYSDLRAKVFMRDVEGTRGKALAFRTNGDFIGYNVNVRSTPFNDVVLGKGPFSPASILAIGPALNNTGDWVEVEIEAIGPRIRVWVAGTLAIDYTDPDPIPSGWLFLGINAGGSGSAHVEFDDFSVIDLGQAVTHETITWGAFKSRF